MTQLHIWSRLLVFKEIDIRRQSSVNVFSYVYIMVGHKSRKIQSFFMTKSFSGKYIRWLLNLLSILTNQGQITPNITDILSTRTRGCSRASNRIVVLRHSHASLSSLGRCKSDKKICTEDLQRRKYNFPQEKERYHELSKFCSNWWREFSEAFLGGRSGGRRGRRRKGNRVNHGCVYCNYEHI